MSFCIEKHLDLSHSELVEGKDIHGLDLILESLDKLGNGIGGDLVILDGGSDDDLEDTVGDWLLLPLGLPVKTVHLNSNDLVGESLEVGVLTPWLDLPNNERLGNGSGLLLLVFGLRSLLLESLSGGGSLLWVLIGEWVEVILLSGSSGGGLLFLLLGSGLLLLATLLALLSYAKNKSVMSQLDADLCEHKRGRIG